MDKKEIKFVLSNISPFNKLKEKEIDKFISISKIREYENGEIIYKQGDSPDYFNLILKGRVIALTKEAAQESEIELLKRGTCFGIISLFNDEPHSVTTKSIEHSFILKVEKEQFKKFLESHPLISLDFSRILSERVRSRFQPKKIFQSKRIAVLGSLASGKTTYMYNLGKKLKEQTRKKIICIELFSKDNINLSSDINKNYNVLNLYEFKEEQINSFIIQGDIDYLLVKMDEIRYLASLLNFLSENYHFILYEIPFSFWKNKFQEFISLSHHIHFLIPSEIKEIEKGSLLITELKNRDPNNQYKLKVIINDFTGLGDPSLEIKTEIIDHPIYARLPSYKDENYFKALRRIARELGEVVTGLALGSGAAYGFAHVGVLKVLQENSIPVDIISGSSTGALIAAMWAVGFSAEEIEKIIIKLGRRFSLFSLPGLAFPFRGLLRARRLEKIFRDIFKDRTFFDLKCNLKIVTFDFLKREARILDEGLIYRAVAASCAMPGVFEPVMFKKEILLDGGILNPLPTKILLSQGAHKIISVNITPTKEEIYKEYERHNKLHIFDFIFGSIETMQREFIVQAMKISDVVIHPHFEGLGWMEFDRVQEIIKIGEQATREKLKEISDLIIS